MEEERAESEAQESQPVETTTVTPAAQNKPATGLVVGGVVVVVLLIIAGLFLPPISLGERLFGDDATPTTGVADTATAAPESTDAPGVLDIPGEAAVSLADPNSMVNLSVVDPANLAAEAIAALPAQVKPLGNVYKIAHQGDVMGRVALTMPAGANSAHTDLYGFDGAAWRFVPSQVDGVQIVSPDHNLLDAFALVETEPPVAKIIAAELLPDEEFPAEIGAALDAVSLGKLTLVGNGAMQGEVADVDGDDYTLFVRATNVGAVIDQASLSAFLGDTTAQGNQINALVNTAVSSDYAGVNLDYQRVAASQRAAFTSFVNSLADALHAQELQLVLTLGTPQETGGNWDSGGQDWAALGQFADQVYVQMPLDPTAYGEDGLAMQLLNWATRQIDRAKVVPLISANAADRLGESFVELSNDQALQNFGTVDFAVGGAEVEPDTPVEVILSGNAGPLEWDGSSVTYRYSYEDEAEQAHVVWLANPAALTQRLALVNRYAVRGVVVRGLARATDGPGYAAALATLADPAEAPETAGAAIVWKVLDENESVVASSSGSDLDFAWEGSSTPGSYTIEVDFALGETLVSLGKLDVAIAVEEEDAVAAGDATEGAVAVDNSVAVEPTGDANAIVNVNANVRTGPGLAYGLIAGGLTAGTQIEVIGRNSDASWLQLLMPTDGREGWIFASLVTPGSTFDVSALPVVEVAAAAPPSSGDSGGTTPAAPPPAIPPAAGGGNFELGGQTFGAPYGMMSYAGMSWVKRQHKWSSGQSADAVQGMINEAHNAGFKILISIPGQVYPSSLPDFGAYTEFLRGVASLPNPPDAIEIWNEMNIDAEWPPGQISPTSYVNNMLAPAYNAIKGANPNIMVISGAPAPTGFFGGGCGTNGCDDAPYMQGMAAAGAASYMDCIGIHYNEGIISPNQTSGDPRSEHYTRYFWGMVDAYYNAFGGSRPLCFTEIGYLSPDGYGGLPGNFAWAGNTTATQQAQWLGEAVSLSANSGKVRLFIVWNVDSTTWGNDPQAGFAIIRPGGGCPACETLRGVMGQ